MNDAANTYRNWILEQGIAGCTLKSLDDEHIHSVLKVSLEHILEED